MNLTGDYIKQKQETISRVKHQKKTQLKHGESKGKNTEMNIKDTRDMVKVPTIREENKAKTIFDKIGLPKIFPQMAKTPRNTTNSKKNNYK